MAKLFLYPFIALGLIFLPSCSSGTNSADDKSESIFYPNDFYEKIVKNASNCDFGYLTPDHEPSTWKSKKASEADKYSWVEFDSLIDYYEFRLEDKSSKGANLEDMKSTQRCIDFLTLQIDVLNTYKDLDAKNLHSLYQDLLKNRQSYLEQAKLMASTEINNANRAIYLKFEGAKRTLNGAMEVTFFEARKLIDFSWSGSVKVFIERCPDAFSISGINTQINGSILLTNTSASSETVNITVRYQDNEGIFIGDDIIFETVPGNSKVRREISGAGASGAVTGGAIFPARCILTFD